MLLEKLENRITLNGPESGKTEEQNVAAGGARYFAGVHDVGGRPVSVGNDHP